ncbi:MAG: 4Fe-4S dicluster domain-containing protein [Acidobacteria bacterium]|jgi:molybdopterin-containing oxidoreductase family iron-sulfur binding subunit|nr:4Fe-4S dicluster domain-containing protein [Acidobacteriota bacterium]
MDRRKFLGIAAGASALAIAGSALPKVIGGGSEGGTEPSSAVRWAMVIDPSKCLKKDGCTACMDACDKIHNIPDFHDPKHEVKWIWKEPFENAFPEQENKFTAEKFKDKPFILLCNHCDNPPCVRVCPTQATWKREDGIVMMDWHRCIGCRYCMAACPYGSRSFNWLDPRTHIERMDPGFPTRTKGVVEKCTLCEERIARGEKPACVEACPEKAMVFGNLSDPKSEARQLLQERYSIRRKPELGTQPEVYYLID